MPTSRCPIVRAQKPPYQDRTTDYHDWTDRSGLCRFCGQPRRATQVDVTLRPRTWAELDDDAPARREWPAVMTALAGLR